MNREVKMINPLRFSLIGAVIFIIIYTLIDYILKGEFSYIGLIGGLVWFFISLITYNILKKVKKS